MDFWLAHGLDDEFGGFHATLNRFGEPLEPSLKGLVQQTRHLYAFSVYHRFMPSADRARRAEVQRRADAVFHFVVEHFLDPEDGEFIFRVDRRGRPEDRAKHLYSNSFAIYGLSEYALAFGSEQAKDLALRCFRSLDARSHEARFGGYDQSNRPNWLTPGAAKDTNTHLHLMESFTELYRATLDPQVRLRAEELVFLMLNEHVQPDHRTHAEFALDFTPLGVPTISYGHDIEVSWLLFDALESLGLPDALREPAAALGENAVRLGFDPKVGGFFEEGIPDGPATKLEKVWWVQAEALAGLTRLYLYRKDPRFLDFLERTLDFSENYLRDPNYGEWYWSVLPDGTFGPRRDLKSVEWKSSYHLVRGLLLTAHWLTVPK